MNQHHFAFAISAFLLVGCGQPEETKQDKLIETAELGNAVLSNKEGDEVGRLRIYQDGAATMLKIEVSSLAPGEKAAHLHMAGKCDAPDFKSAGGHLNPLNATHGKHSESGPHFGDLPNLTISESGTANASVELVGDTAGVAGHIFDEDGTALIIHEGPDDYRSDPSGNAGSRIACGVIAPKS